MAIETFSSFVLFLILPHYLTYLFYIAFKYLQLIYALIWRACPKRIWSSLIDRNCVPRRERRADLNLIDGVLFLISLFCLCCCCCCCCGKKKNLYCKARKKAEYYRAKIDRLTIKILLGRQEGVVEKFEDSFKNDELDRDGLPKLYIRNKLLTPHEVDVLALLIITFGILIFVTAFDLFFLKITHSCSENPKIYCFVTSFGSRSDQNLTNERITDCQYYWNNENITASFTCFRWAYDLKTTTAAVGGLITIFQYTVKITTGLLIAGLDELQSFNNEPESKGSTPCCIICKKLLRCCARNITKIRNVLAFIVGFVEIGFASFLVWTFVVFLGKDEDDVDPFINFFLKNGNQVVLFLGIIGTCLLLPLEEYASSTHNLEDRPLLPRPPVDNALYQNCTFDKTDFTHV